MDILETRTSLAESSDKIIPFPIQRLSLEFKAPKEIKKVIETPASDKIIAQAKKLDLLSKYPSAFNYEIYRDIERRFSEKPIRGGITLGTAFRLVNSHSTCQQCLYSFEIDTYGRGCSFNCAYCYAKAQLTVHGYWNNPMPVPINVNEIRKAFYLTFETEKPHKWREVLEQRIPLRIGSMSDSFMWSDLKYGVTQELLKILKFYNYPYIVFTRSDLIAHDDYMKLLDPDLSAIQFSMSSTNEDLIKQIEPGAPSAKRRLKALQKLSEAGFWTTVRMNPFFPIRPDGFYTDPNFKWNGEIPKFDFSSFEMVDEIASYKVPAILAGFVRLSGISLNAIERSTGFNLRQFYNRGEVNKSSRDFHYSDKEIRHYYQQIQLRCMQNKVQFTTCYIGNGENHFWKDQDLWSNRRDCCNAKSRVSAFKSDSRQIAFETRLKYTNYKDTLPDSERLHDELGKVERKKDSPLRDEPSLSI
jgi:DNA repair photolyase